MPRRDDDIFRKLKNEKPLIKTSGSSASADPDKQRAFDLMLEKKTGAAKKKAGFAKSSRHGSRTVAVKKTSAEKPKELDIFSPVSPSSVKIKEAVHDIGYGSKTKREPAAMPEFGAEKIEKKTVQQKKQPQSELEVGESSDIKRVLHKPYTQKKQILEKRQPAAKPELEVGSSGVAERSSYKAAPEKKPEVAKSTTEQYGLEFEEPGAARKASESSSVRKQNGITSNIGRTAISRPVYSNPYERVRKSFRHEHKYYINYKDHIVLSTALNAVMRRDDNVDENGGYHIRSLYFDDVHETALADKIAGNDDRSKYRIRIYNFKDDNIRLEKKQKHGKFISKTSLQLSRYECDSIIAGDGNFLLEKNDELAREFYILMKTRLMRPKVIVDYWREAYVYPIEDVRVTFDIDLKGSTMMTDIFDPNTPVMPVFDNGLMVLEVKFNRYLPESIKCALGSVGAVKRSAISKYVLCRKYD